MNSSRAIRFGAFVGSALAFALVAGPAGAASSSLVYTNGVASGWTPSSVSIDPGGTVTWENRDGQYDHPVECVQQDSNAPCPWSGAKDLPKKPQIGSAPRVSQTFPVVGTFGFRCAIHPTMTGTVIVGSGHPAASSSPSATPRRSSGAAATARASTTTRASASATPGATASVKSKTSSRGRGTTAPAPSLSRRTLAETKTAESGPSAGATIPAALLIALVAAAHVVRARRRSA